MLGFLRETKESAIKSGLDETGINRTGLDEYLKVIFPNTVDWLHNKCLPNIESGKRRPDYFSPSLKLIVEFDGLPHYQNPDIVIKDRENKLLYESLGYKVVRIPYFIQLNAIAIKKYFDVDIKEEMVFNYNYPSFSISARCTPAYLCPLGIERAVDELKEFPDQLELNLTYLKEHNHELTGYDTFKFYLEK